MGGYVSPEQRLEVSRLLDQMREVRPFDPWVEFPEVMRARNLPQPRTKEQKLRAYAEYWWWQPPEY